MASTIKPVIVDASSTHTATIIFLHGLGDTGHGWAEELADIKPSYAKLICPTAPTAPVTINMGMSMPSWFDIRSLNKNNPDQDEEGIKKAASNISALIQAQIDGGIPPSRILLGGFSQGGALSLYTGLTGPHSLSSIISLSGYLPISNSIDWSSAQKPNIFQAHGDSDSVVPLEYGDSTGEKLKSHLGEGAVYKVYRGMGHSSSEEEMRDVQEFIKKSLPPV